MTPKHIVEGVSGFTDAVALLDDGSMLFYGTDNTSVIESFVVNFEQFVDKFIYTRVSNGSKEFPEIDENAEKHFQEVPSILKGYRDKYKQLLDDPMLRWFFLLRRRLRPTLTGSRRRALVPSRPRHVQSRVRVARCTSIAWAEHAAKSEDALNSWPAASLFSRHDFLNPSPGTALKHKVLQVKFGACTICGCQQATGRLLNALIGQSGQIKLFVNDAL